MTGLWVVVRQYYKTRHPLVLRVGCPNKKKTPHANGRPFKNRLASGFTS